MVLWLLCLDSDPQLPTTATQHPSYLCACANTVHTCYMGCCDIAAAAARPVMKFIIMSKKKKMSTSRLTIAKKQSSPADANVNVLTAEGDKVYKRCL
eukprot:6469053-Amphidinium_carterae.1